MGILKHLLFWPVTGPAFLARFSLEKVQGVVREELTDEGRVKEKLLDLQLRLELGDIDDDEYLRQEAQLMEELRDVRRWKEEFGMGSRGGVVRLPAKGEPSDSGEDADTSVPPGASLEVSLGWDAEDEEDDGKEEER
jgi:hypothetical protein